MWKKNEVNDPSVRPATPVEPARPAQTAAPVRIAYIGRSLSINGELDGEEDLFIEGRIEGKITLNKGSVTVGEKGRVHADVEATNIQVAGEVEGNLLGREQVVLLETGRVHGNIKAKSVTLQNGAQFKGSIDMESASGSKDSTSSGVVSGKVTGSSHSVPATPENPKRLST
jgi:cytoskeletal protein CcmA (bactofilin family)